MSGFKPLEYYSSLEAMALRQEALLAAIPDIIMEVDASKVYTWSNQAGLDFFGDDVVGRDASSYFEGEQQVYNTVQPLFDGHEEVIYVESWQRRSDGVKRLLAWWCRVLKDGQGKVLGALSSARDITEQKMVEQALREKEQRLTLALEGAADGIWDYDVKQNAIFRSSHVAIQLGYGSLGLPPTTEAWLDIVHPDDLPLVLHAWQSHLDGKTDHYAIEHRLRATNGEYIWILDSGKIVERGENGQPLRVAGTHKNITERKRSQAEQEKLQAQLLQAQKIESVGRLAGGVAHDFNNMLGVILGHVELALETALPGQPLHDNLLEIRKAANRSADLTRQLLAFARKQTIAPRVLNLNDTVDGMLKMLQRLIGENIELQFKPDPQSGLVKMDPSQLDQILANLCVNARDAISGVGKVTIEITTTTFEGENNPDIVENIPSQYVLLSVADTGCGMDKDTLGKIFEPFFTSKELGKGTGLGLATIYGIVKQNQGYIEVHSQPGQGTTFTLYLPCYQDKDGGPQAVNKTSALPRGQETILLVEDEAAILKVTKAMLEYHGYTVLTASSPGEAMRLAEAHSNEINLLMTDVVMPEMNGRDLAKNLLSLYPKLGRLFMSGYTADVIAHQGVLEPGVHFLQKPFTMKDLAGKVREAMGREE